MLTYGCTRLEIGVQSVYEDVARDTNRSVTIIKDTCNRNKVKQSVDSLLCGI